MQVHLPKPLHGWRAFGGEVGVIVIGVLIALAAQQIVEALSWREKASHAREALREEIYGTYLASAERVVVAPCLNAQLDRLKADVLYNGRRSAAATSSTPFGPMIYRHPNRLWSDAAWQSTIIEQVSSHLSADERGSLSRLYASVAVSRDINEQELKTDGQLMILASPLQLDNVLRGQLLGAIETQRIHNNSMELIARQQLDLASEAVSGIKATLGQADWLRAMRGPTSTIGWCRSQKLPLADMPKVRS